MYRLDAGPVPEIPEGVQGRHDGQEGRQISGMMKWKQPEPALESNRAGGEDTKRQR